MTVEKADYYEVTFSQHTSVTSDLLISCLEPQLRFEVQELAETCMRFHRPGQHLIT